MLKELTEMGLMDSSEEATFKHAFDETEVYLRTDFKMHVKEESWISDHCLNHTLSDPFDARFASHPKNDHQHDQKCEMCEMMDYIFSDIKKKLQTLTEQATAQNEMKLLDIKHDFETSIEKILDLKSHHVRSSLQWRGRRRSVICRSANRTSRSISPRSGSRRSSVRPRRTSSGSRDNFRWHFAHVYAIVNGELVQHVYIHIFKNDVQNRAVVVEVIKHIAEDLANMGIRIMHLRSDNAGYYHSAPVMASVNKIAAEFKIEIASWRFSEAQAGKSTADRYCALSKGVMRCYIAKGNNIDTHEKIFIALTKGKLLRRVSVHLGTVTHKDLPKTKIPGISNLGHFEFDGKDTISAWKFRGIGDGMKVNGLEGIESSVVWHEHGGMLWKEGLMEEDKHKIAEGKEPHFWFFPKKNTSPEPGDVDDEAVTGEPIAFDPTSFNPTSPLFVCSQCSSEFIRQGSLLRHIESGRHKIRPEKISQFDFALGMYKRMLENVQQGIGIYPLADSYKKFQQAPAHPKPMGWALRTIKKGAKYNVKAKKLVVDLFEEYFKQSKKLRAEEAEKKMKDTQIFSLLSRSSRCEEEGAREDWKRKSKKKSNSGGYDHELDEEGGSIEEEVEVDEDDREITADDIYDMIHTNMAEFFDDPENIVNSTRDVGYFDE